MTFGEHLDILVKVLIRVAIVSFVIAILAFFFKDTLFAILLAPCQPDFPTYDLLRSIVPGDIHIYDTRLDLIATGLSSQFMAHLSYSLYIGILVASPYIVFELFRYVSPALYDNERRMSAHALTVSYILFVAGLLISYFILFPFSCRFLATYSVSDNVTTLPTLDSYLSMFITLTLLMGVVFQLPLLAYLLSRWGLITAQTLIRFRRHAFVAILVVAAIITPPDIMTLLIVSLPLYLLYEVSILVVRIFSR